MNDYENMRRVSYDCSGDGSAVFVPVHEGCGLIVKADDSIFVGYKGLKDQPNATCKKHGRVQMIFEGFFEHEQHPT